VLRICGRGIAAKRIIVRMTYRLIRWIALGMVGQLPARGILLRLRGLSQINMLRRNQETKKEKDLVISR
jgi:hypothetical protein